MCLRILEVKGGTSSKIHIFLLLLFKHLQNADIMKLKLLLTGLILMLGLFPAKASLQEPEKDNTEQSKAQKERPASPDVEEVGQVKPKGKVEASSRSEAAPQKSKSLQSAHPNLERGEKGAHPNIERPAGTGRPAGAGRPEGARRPDRPDRPSRPDNPGRR